MPTWLMIIFGFITALTLLITTGFLFYRAGISTTMIKNGYIKQRDYKEQVNKCDKRFIGIGKSIEGLHEKINTANIGIAKINGASSIQLTVIKTMSDLVTKAITKR